MGANELNCRWHFSTHSGATQDVGPNNAAAEHFKETPYPSLIRESIQNSLDVVKDPTKPVKMVFSFKKLRSRSYENFFKLKEHIDGVLKYYGTKAEAEYKPMLDIFNNTVINQEVIHYISVSDYNTVGMDFMPDNTDSPFYAFVRAIGVTVKTDSGSGGSFGFGKSAYFVMSPIHTVLISTMTDSGKTFFEGAATLCTHVCKNENGVETKYTHYGFYDSNNGEAPSTKDDIPTKFRRTEVGSDIMIMGVDGSDEARVIAYDEMIKATLKHFWMSILNGKLEVTIGDIEITAETLDDLMREHCPHLLDRAKDKNNYNPRPYYEAVKNAGVSKQYIKKDAILDKLGHVSLYLYKNMDARDGIIHMRKQGMYIYRSRAYSNTYGYYGVFVCTDPTGNKLLKGIEDPSHTRWEANRDKINGRLIVSEIDTFISNTLKEVFVNENGGPLGITGLEDYLFVPEELIASEEDNNGNPFFGNPSDAMQDTGVIPDSEIRDTDPEFKPVTDDAIGRIVIHTPPTSAEAGEEGTLGGHKRTSTRKKKKGKGSTPGNGSYKPVEGAPASNLFENIPVEYRVIAENKNGKLIHSLVIHSDYDVANGEIEIIVGGEDKDEEVDIIYSSLGNPSGNIIKNVPLSKDERNVVEIQFSDNMKHVVKLTAYEFK